MPLVLMRCGGNVLELSCDGGPLPMEFQKKCELALTYSHLYALRGADAYDAMGNYQPTRTETKTMWSLDRKGRFLASLGWRYRLEDMVRQAGYGFERVSVDHPHPRPDRYAVDWERLFERMDLRPKQDELLASLEPVDHGLIDIPPACGKTFNIAAYALAHYKARIHIVTEGLDILRRIDSHMTKFFPNVGFVAGSKQRFGERITVISSDSLHKVGEGFDDPRSPRAADVVFFDEVHKAASPSVLEQVSKYKYARMYGLSASIDGRFDKAHAQLEGIFGRRVFTLTYPEAVALKLCAPVRVEWVNVSGFRSPGEGARGTRWEKLAIWTNDARNQAIADKVRSFPPDTQILVMVSRSEHAAHLKRFLPEFEMCYDQMDDYDRYVEAGYINPATDPKVTPQRRMEMLKQFEAGTLRRVIATDVWSTGVDFVNLGVVVRADARASAIMDIQIPGRANRIADGKEWAVIVDTMDEFDPAAESKSRSRERNYRSRGWTQVGLSRRRPAAGG